MKASSIPATAEAGGTTGPQQQVLAKREGKSKQFERAFTEFALKHHARHAATAAKADQPSDEATNLREPNGLADLHGGPLNQAWRKLANVAEPNSAADGSRLPLTSDDAEPPENNAACEAAASTAIALSGRSEAGTDEGHNTQDETECSNSSRSAQSERARVTPHAPEFGRLEPPHQSAETIDTASRFAPIKLLGEETHFAPASSSYSNQALNEPDSEDGSDTNRGIGLRRAERMSGANDVSEPRKPGISATPAMSQGAPADSELDARSGLSAPAAQILDGLLGKGDWTGERNVPSAPVASQIEEKAPQNAFARTIKIQLAPESLGLVNVVVTRGEASLRIRLEADVGETRSVLHADRDAITRQLEARGLQIDELVVLRLSDAGTATSSDSRSATASSWASESHMDHRSQDGQPRQPAKDWPADERGNSQPEEAKQIGAQVQSSREGERFLGRRMLRSI